MPARLACWLHVERERERLDYPCIIMCIWQIWYCIRTCNVYRYWLHDVRTHHLDLLVIMPIMLSIAPDAISLPSGLCRRKSGIGYGKLRMASLKFQYISNAHGELSPCV